MSALVGHELLFLEKKLRKKSQTYKKIMLACIFASVGSAVELSDTDSLSSPARPATSRAQTRAAGPTRAIARTQQSERVRASVNRHRITQARTSQVWHEA